MVVAAMRTAPPSTNPDSSTFVADSTIPKVSETPLEGPEGAACEDPETFGPFNCDPDESSTMIKLPNKKGHSVHFEKAQQDPIEKAFDNMFLLYDDVREVGNTLREDGMNCGGNNTTDEEGAATSMPDFTETFECVTDGLCRNPCVDSCSKMHMQPPVDLMLSVTDKVDEEARDGAAPVEDIPAGNETPTPAPPAAEAPAAAPAVTRPVARAVNFMLCKENSVRDMDVVETPAKEAPEPTYTNVETVVDKMKTMVPEDIVQQLLDVFAQKYRGDKDDSDKLQNTALSASSGDPIVDAIDNLIFFFEDMQVALEKQRASIEESIKTGTCELPAMPEFDINPIMAALEAIKDYSNTYSSDETVVSNEDTVKAGNFKVKPLSAQMSPELYAEALHSVASLLSENAPEEDLKIYTKEELHQRALEKIMSERDETFSEGEYKTEEMILRELMADAETAIMDARSKSTDEASPAEAPLNEELIVLGHSATLTPIPEADEGSTGGAPVTTDKIAEGVKNGTCPEVPLAPPEPEEQPVTVITQPASPVEKKQAMLEEATAPVEEKQAVVEEVAKTVVEEQPAPVVEELPPVSEWKSPFAEKEKELPPEPLLVKVIDGLFLCYDDLKEQKGCTSCLGSSVPSDMVDDSADEMEPAQPRDVVETTKSMESKPQTTFSTEESTSAPVEELTEGQRMIQEALQLVQEVSKMSEDEARLGVTRPVPQPMTVDTPGFMDQISKVLRMKESEEEAPKEIINLVDAAYESSDEKRLLRGGQATKLVVEIPESLKNAQQQDSYAAWGDDSELMASINADRKYSEQEHVNIFRDVSKEGTNKGEFSLYRTQAFTAGNSSSAELVDGTEHSQAALKALCEQSMSGEGK